MSLGDQTAPRGQAPSAIGQATVTAASATTLGTIPIPPGCACLYRVGIVGDDTNGTETHEFVYYVAARRTAAGAPVLGTNTAIFTHRDRSGSAVSFAANATGIEVRFTGINGRTIAAGFRAYAEDWR